ncbi:MAG: Gfo/Idh/MocA family oxidoreductase [Planctomycetota bacterium]|nr:Gfo/Idh/MocA family oxidoreductase [Planctomycetota bacterium]
MTTKKNECLKRKTLKRRMFLGATAVSALMPSSPGWLANSGHCAPSRGQRKKLRVGQVGVGHAHATKLSVYRNSEDYEVVGISEPDNTLRNRVQNQKPYQDLQWMSLEELLNVKELDVVLVETRVRDSLDVAEKCISAGKHIHLDKPAGESFLQFNKILQEAEKKELMIQMGYMYRYNPAIVLLRDVLKKGWLGEIFEVHTVMSKVVDSASRTALARYPGGIMFELGCHILDLTIGVLGKPDSVSSVRRHSSPLKDPLVDNMLAILAYEKAIATVKSTAQEVEGFARRHFVVCGTEGTFHIQPLDNPTVRVAFSKKQGQYQSGYQELTFPRYHRYVDDAADMAKVLRGEKISDFSYDHDRVVQGTLMEACGLATDH